MRFPRAVSRARLKAENDYLLCYYGCLRETTMRLNRHHSPTIPLDLAIHPSCRVFTGSRDRITF